MPDGPPSSTRFRARLSVPRSIAVVGASGPDGAYHGARMWANVSTVGFEGKLYAVNPRRAGTEIAGHPVYASLTDLPETPDLVAIAVPAGAVGAVLEEAGAKGAKTCVIITAHEGSAAERVDFDRMIGATAERYGMTVFGPNSIGVLNGRARVAATFASNASAPGALRPGNVGIVSQSGAALGFLLQAFEDEPIGYSWVISTGNEAAVHTEAVLETLVEDPDVRVIHLFIEGVGDGDRFRRALLRARVLGKAVVCLRVGLSDVGREAVVSHTGRVANSAGVYRTLGIESGMVLAGSYRELFDATVALSVDQNRGDDHPHQRRALVISTSGGAASYAADALRELGWSLPPVPPAIRESAAGIGVTLSNPSDVPGTYRDPAQLPRLLSIIDNADDYDAIFMVTGGGGRLAPAMAGGIAEFFPRMRNRLYVGWIGVEDETRRILTTAGIPAFDDPRRAVLAAEAVAVSRAVGPDAAAEVLESLGAPSSPRSRTAAARWRSAGEALTDLRSAGVAVSPMRLVPVGDDTIGAARELGYPVALKIDSASAQHKTELQGVIIRLGDDEAVRDATSRLTAIIDTIPDNDDATLLVQRMASGVEVLVGIKHDDAFGPMLVIGMGGTQAELLGSPEIVLLPTTREQLGKALDRHALLSTILAGYRGAPAANRSSLLDLLERFAEWALSSASPILEADLNPVMVDAEGSVVVDARYLS